MLQTSEPGSRGPDLRARVEVSHAAISEGEGVVVSLASQLDGPGGPMAWAHRSEDPPGSVTLHIGTDFPEGGVIRLRGQGGCRDGDSAPGDLHIEVCFRAPQGPGERWLAMPVAVRVLVVLAGASVVAAGLLALTS